MAKAKPQPTVLKGWQAVAQFLGQPPSTVQGWAKEGMPVERRGQMVQALPDKLNLWLGRETRESLQSATETPDLPTEVRCWLACVRRSGRRSGKRQGIARRSRSGKRR
jgi:hypothetical protein